MRSASARNVVLRLIEPAVGLQRKVCAFHPVTDMYFRVFANYRSHVHDSSLLVFAGADRAVSSRPWDTRSAALTTTGPSRLDLSRSLTPHPPPSPSCCHSYVQPGSSGVDTHTTSPPHVTTHKPRLTFTITSHCQHTTRTAQGAHGTTPTQHNTFIHSLIRPTRPLSLIHISEPTRPY